MESSRIIVQVISKEMIKPSSPTPPHLSKHNLSLLDQLQSPFYFPLILFYESPSGEKQQQQQHPELVASMKETWEKLKKSLSETLTIFYPLAGRLHKENLTVVNCVDAGANYVEARAHHAHLSDVVCQEKHHDSLGQYLPVIPLAGLTDDGVLLHVQVTFFDCGGFVLGVCLSHRVGDAGSMVSFLNSWAATCRRGKPPHQQIKPCFDLAAHFPVQGLSSSVSGSKYLAMCNSPMPPELPNTLVTKRVVFDKEKLAQLMRAAENNDDDDVFVVKRPTRVELVSAFIWKCFTLMGASSSRSVNCAMVAVNIRTRVIPPPTLEHSFGNGMLVIPYVFTEQEVPQYQDMVRKIRNTIARVSDEYIRTIKTEEDGGFLGELHNYIDVLMRGGVEEFCCISSWSRFPLYDDVDYGWGGPVWVATTGMYQNFAILIDSKSGNGIEAWITIPRSTAGTLLETLSNTQQLIHY